MRPAELEGKVIGGLPYGYDLAVDGKTLIENPVEQEALALIHNLKALGRTLRDLADELNSGGYQAKKGGSWTFGQVQNVLRKAA